MKSKHDLNYVIQDSQRLLNFIMGEGEFLTNQSDDGYFRLLELEKYYKSLNEASAHKKTIKQSVLGLFGKNDNSAKYVSILLGRIMEIDEMIPVLIDLISSNERKSISRHFEKEVYISATHFRIAEVSKKIVNYYLENKDLMGFLSGHMFFSDFEKNILKNIISEDELWRVDCLVNYYEDCPEFEKQDIKQQLMSVIEKYPAVLNLFNAYQEKEANYKHFINLTEELHNIFSGRANGK